MCIISHIIDISGPHTLLHIDETDAARVFLSEKIRYERLHTRRIEKHRWIILGYERCRRYYGMLFRLKEFEVFGTDFCGSNNHKSIYYRVKYIKSLFGVNIEYFLPQ